MGINLLNSDDTATPAPSGSVCSRSDCSNILGPNCSSQCCGDWLVDEAPCNACQQERCSNAPPPSQNLYPNIVGASVPKFGPVIDGNFRSMERDIVRQVWNTNCYGKTSHRGPQIGGFRRVMNAGDYLGRVNAGCGGSNQITKRPGSLVLSTKDGVRRCNSEVPVANTNVKYVYDSSDFIRYRREKSINKGYAGGRTDCDKGPHHLMTDYSYGGSGFPLGRGRQMFVNGMNSYGH